MLNNTPLTQYIFAYHNSYLYHDIALLLSHRYFIFWFGQINIQVGKKCLMTAHYHTLCKTVFIDVVLIQQIEPQTFSRIYIKKMCYCRWKMSWFAHNNLPTD